MIWRHNAILQLLALVVADGQSDLTASMESYAPKGCKYNPLPSFLNSRAFTSYTGEVRVHDVFGLQSTVKRHILRLDVGTASLLTLQVEVHRDTPATLTVDAYRRGEVGKPSGRVLNGANLLGCGGDDTKAFLHGLLSDKDLEIDIVFELASVEVAASQVDSRVAEARCWPVRLDLAAIPTSRAALHWPVSCLAENRLPPSLQDKAGGNQITELPDQGLTLAPPKDAQQHYVYGFGDERPWTDFNRALWSGIVEVPTRLHRFVRIFIRASFRFSSSPLQLAIELFDLKDTPDSTALAPKCVMGCLGGVPVYNGQVIDHAMPTGFRYRFWVLAAGMSEWTSVIRGEGRHCLEFDLDYSIKFEQRMTPFEIGPAAWLCESSRLPAKIVQTPRPWATDKLASQEQLVAGRSIWIRDRFGFPPEETADMEHKIEIEVSEPCVFRATTHHSDGVDVFVALSRKGETERACKTLKHPGPVPRQTIFCMLQPGTYVLTFFADYPLGGLHPCSDFFAQVALRPTALASEDKTRQCLATASDLSTLQVQRSLALTTTPNWKAIKVPITFENSPATVSVWSTSLSISEEDASQRLFMRLVVHSDYISSDIRFQVRFSGRYIADTQVTSHGYADMIGPLDPGMYYIDMYYVAGTGGSAGVKLCSTSMVDLRIVSRSAYGKGNTTAQWLCTSTRVPPPDLLAPQADEQVLLDSEYVVPESGQHTLKLKVEEPRLVRVKLSSSDVEFTIELWTRGASQTLLARGTDSLEMFVGAGTFLLKLRASSVGLGSPSSCSTFLLNLLLQPQQSLPVCPWSPTSSDRTATAEAQKAAADHIGDLLLDLVPKTVSKDVTVKPAVTLWMSQGMEKTFDMTVDTTSAVRIDVSIQPPWLPLEISMRRKRASGKLEAPIASAEWTESRLLLMQSDLPKGSYVIEFKQSRRYTVQAGSGLSDETLANLCAHVTIHAEVGISSKEAVNTLRSELLDLPDLLAVQPLPSSLNTVGWFGSPMLPVVGTQVFRFKEATEKMSLKVDEKSIIRIISEPADLSNADITCELLQGSTRIATADSLGQLLAEVQPGSYDLSLTPKAKSPFLVTVGLATVSRLKEDFALQDSGKRCLSKFPSLADGVIFSAKGWAIGPRIIRLKQSFLGMEGMLGSLPIELKTSSVVYIEAGSALPLDLIRIALKVPEGLWVGEQRGARNSLEIELPAGSYEVQVSQPKPLRMDTITRCLEFSVKVTATPLNPGAAADKAASASIASAAADGGGASATSEDSVQKQELSAREEAIVEAAPCFAMGTLPLPLDFSDPKGGSAIMGGPLDKNGRLSIRTHALLTDMHDGRKKVFVQSIGQKLQLKIGVILGGHARFSMASQLSFAVIPLGAAALDPVESWDTPDGWERVYILDANSFWLSFHHNHRERSESACLHFGLQLEVHPVTDVPRMMSCFSDAKSPTDALPDRLDTAGSTTKMFRYSQKAVFLRQVQNGFITSTKFTVSVPSYVVVEAGFNFFTSHAEMDIIEDKAGQKTMIFGERDFLHTPDDALNAQVTIGHTLAPGEYILRVADDHYVNQVSGEGCFPFSLDFRLVPEKVEATVLSVKPHPSVPVTRGTDLVLTLRFSEPPRGSIDDVVRAISLGGVSAMTGGSWNAMDQKFASDKKSSVVQASAAEGHLVWTIGWNAQSLPDVGTAKLKIGDLRSNRTNKRFRFNPPTYTIVAMPTGTPWKGGALVSSSAAAAGTTIAPPSTPAVPERTVNLLPAKGGVGEFKPEGSAGVPKASAEDVGTARAEGSKAEAPVRGARAGEIASEGGAQQSSQNEDDADHAPRVQEWSPMDASDSPAVSAPDASSASAAASPPASSGSADYSPLDRSDGECPEGTTRNAATGACEVSSALPLGYRPIVIGCSFTAIGFFFYFWSPRLRSLGGAGKTPNARFQDVGARTSAEELGLMTNRDFEDDDDML